MKFTYRIALTLIIFGNLTTLQAQNLTISEQQTKNEETIDVDAWVAHLDQNMDYAEKSFEKFMKETFDYRTDKIKKTNVIKVEKVKFAEISPLRVDMRAVFAPEGAGCMVSFMMSPGYDIHFLRDTYPQEYAKIQDILKKFIKFNYNRFYKESIADAEDKIKSKQKDIASNNKKMENLQKDIAENEQKINNNDKNSNKLIERNSKYKTQITNLQAENATLNNDISQLQNNITKHNEALQKVFAFQ
ncbi:MAG: hypothetical protein MUE85_10025 [Microscillaceae bacterium]|jgi:hypothetical protein|nr:hypothetical protein [Microscillaceae bacterium]